MLPLSYKLFHNQKILGPIRYLVTSAVHHSKCKDVDEFTTVYTFPLIRICSVVNRLKYYQAAVTLISLPAGIALQEAGYLTSESIIATAAIGISGSVSLFFTGSLLERFVGFVYLNKTLDKVKFSYVDSWGRRKDELVDLKDIIPLCELPTTTMDGLYLSIQRYSNKEKLKISKRFGIILDKEKFNIIFPQAEES